MAKRSLSKRLQKTELNIELVSNHGPGIRLWTDDVYVDGDRIGEVYLMPSAHDADGPSLKPWRFGGVFPGTFGVAHTEDGAVEMLIEATKSWIGPRSRHR